MYNFATYNCHNFKSNFNTVEKLLKENDIIFIIEHWLAVEEFHEFNIIDTSNFNILFTSEFSLKDKSRGRPYGGKMWFVKKGINILACYELSNNIMVISVELGNGKSLQIYGVWLKFDDNSSESLENFQSNLLMLESEIKNNVEKKQPFVIMGDWNADLERGRRFDVIYKDFVNNNDLIISDDLDRKR